MTSKYKGIYPMQYAFFDRGGQLCESTMRRQVRACMAAGAHGIAVLGLATEVNKLTAAEKRAALTWLSEEIGGKLPLAVTVTGASVEAQVEFAHFAQRQGASWLILQPPPVRGEPEAYYMEFFSSVMASVDAPVGIQNAPEYIGVGLGSGSILELSRRHRNFQVLKGEGSMLAIRSLIEAVGDDVAVFNGRGGLELIDNLKAGCRGMIPATDTFDYQVRVFESMQRPESAAEAQRIYERILPGIVFTMQSLDTLICYAKRIAAWRLGLDEVHDREPTLLPTAFGLQLARGYAEVLGPLP